MERIITGKIWEIFVRILRLVMLICGLFFLLWGMTTPKDVTLYIPKAPCVLQTGWTQIVDGNPVALEDIEDYIPQEVGTPILLQRPITADMAGENLVFYAEHQEVKITAGDHILTMLKTPEELAGFGSPGRNWVVAYIPANLEGQTVQVALRSNFTMYHGIPAIIYQACCDSIMQVQIDFLWLRNVVAVVVLILAAITYVNANLWKENKKRSMLLAMGDVFLFIGLWLGAEADMLSAWLQRATISSVGAMVFLRIMPIAIYHFFMSMLPRVTWRTYVCGVLVWANLLIALALQIFWKISLVATVPLNVTVVILVCLLGLVDIVIYLIRRHTMEKQDIMMVVALLFPLGALGECHTYCNFHTNSRWLGLCLGTAAMVFACVAHVLLVQGESHTDGERTRLAKEMTRLHKKPLNQQINAHFLYNSLNTISAYCKENPAKADLAVQRLSQYMRAYTHLVGAEDYVPLGEELDMMELYIELQNMRFDNTIDFDVDCDCDDVWVPPLALQSLVENAVNHGIRHGDCRGRISITTKRKYDITEITVRDNGIGFDPKHPPKSKSGVGLKNLKARVEAMGGSVVLKSKPGEGGD